MGDGSIRMRRINEAIKEVLSASIGKGLKDPRIGFVTVTGVETSPDLSGAKVFVSVYGKQSEKEETLEGLRSSEGLLQQEINEHLRMTRTPVLEFVYDSSVDEGMKIEAILKAEKNSMSVDADSESCLLYTSDAADE